MGLPSAHEIFKLMEEVRRAYRETKSVAKAMEVKGPLTEHEVLRICAEEKLKSMGYKVISHAEVPEWIKRVGSPDIVAVRNDEYVIAKAKTSDQLKRYSKTKARLILVTNVEERRAVEVWGLHVLRFV